MNLRRIATGNRHCFRRNKQQIASGVSGCLLVGMKGNFAGELWRRRTELRDFWGDGMKRNGDSTDTKLKKKSEKKGRGKEKER